VPQSVSSYIEGRVDRAAVTAKLNTLSMPAEGLLNILRVTLPNSLVPKLEVLYAVMPDGVMLYARKDGKAVIGDRTTLDIETQSAKVDDLIKKIEAEIKKIGAVPRE
jgi:hypothetical protein